MRKKKENNYLFSTTAILEKKTSKTFYTKIKLRNNKMEMRKKHFIFIVDFFESETESEEEE